MTVRIEKPAINVREELADLRKPTGIAGEAMLRAETPQEQFNLIGAGRRNLIINGAMQVAQRGTSTTGVAEGIDSFMVDRFFSRISVSGGVVTIDTTQENDAPDGFKYSCKTEINGSSTPNDNDQYKIEYRVEGYDLIGAGLGTSNPRHMTLSFWYKSSKAGKACVAFVNNGNDMSYVAPFDVEQAGAWEYKSVTFIAPDDTATWESGNGVGLRIRFGTFGANYQTNSTNSWISGQYMSTSGCIDYTTTDGGYFQITGVQLELGKVATPFEHRSYGEELALCQRYFERISSEGNSRSLFAAGYNESTSTARWILNYEKKRSAPTISDGGGVNNFGILHTSTTLSLNTLTFDQATTRSCRCLGESIGTPLTDGGASILCSVDSDVAYIDIDSEL